MGRCGYASIHLKFTKPRYSRPCFVDTYMGATVSCRTIKPKKVNGRNALSAVVLTLGLPSA
jgi:hypothetical protein